MQGQGLSRDATAAPAAPTRFRVMLPFAVLLVAWQVWTVVGRQPSPFLLSYWFVTWDHGFVRRGLLGEINQLFFGDDLLRGAHVLTWVSGAVAAATVVVVAIALLRLNTPFAIGLGWLLLVSPYTVKGLLNFARPDQLPIPLLVLVAAVWWLRPRSPVLPLFVLGLLFSVLILAHEGVVLTVAPWILLLIVHFSRYARGTVLATRLAAFFTVPALATWLVIDRGAATAKQVQLLAADADGVLPRGEDMIDYMADSTADSAALVADFGAVNLAWMAAVGLVLWAVHLAALGCLPGRPRRLPRADGAVLLTVVLPAFLVQLALAKDWQRWFSLWPTMGLLCLGSCLLVPRHRPATAVGPDAPPAAPWHPRSAVAFVLLAALLFPLPRTAANNRPPCTWTAQVKDIPMPYRHVADVVAGRAHEHRNAGTFCHGD